MPDIWQEFVINQPSHATTWSVNMPSELRDTRIVRARLGRSFYNRCFSAKGEHQYFHDLAGFAVDSGEDTDEAIVRSGRVSVSRIDLSILGQEI
jgi:broad specificity polyphosphatase/5'/3'-nucleotidase SurE